MAYNNGFPMSYPQMYYPQYPQTMANPYIQGQQSTPPVQASQSPSVASQPVSGPQTNGIIWVQGEAGAKSYLVAPNTTVQLWDSESQRIFLKSADATGMPSMKILTYTVEETPSVNAPRVNAPMMPSDFPGKAEQEALKAEMSRFRGDIDSLRAEMDSFRNDLYGIAGKKTTTVKKKEAASDE